MHGLAKRLSTEAKDNRGPGMEGLVMGSIR
jgi:hypothetical protein